MANTRMLRGLSSTYWTLLHLVDTGQTCSIDETYRHIAAGDVIDWLAQCAGEWGTTTGLPASLDADARGEVQDLFERHQNATNPSDFAVSQNGLCLLLAYCINELQAAFD